MAITTYLAMTAAEFDGCPNPPSHSAWMACHFSPYATGLSNFPVRIPDNTMIIVNDIMPIQNHSPQTVAEQLTSLISFQPCSSVLLDFQRSPTDNSLEIAKLLCKALPCPVGVSASYAENLDCPVFLPMCPPHCTLESHITPWYGREIWLEIGKGESQIIISEKGISITNTFCANRPDIKFQDSTLCCHYSTTVEHNRATFTLWQNQEDLHMLLEKAEQLHIQKAVGLYQELKDTI